MTIMITLGLHTGCILCTGGNVNFYTGGGHFWLSELELNPDGLAAITDKGNMKNEDKFDVNLKMLLHNIL